MITSCLTTEAGGGGGAAAAAATDGAPAAATAACARWRLIRLGPTAAGATAPTEAQAWGSRQLLEWAKSREAQAAG